MTPYFESFSDFIRMGEHGQYVWQCYGITLLCLVGMVWRARKERQKFFDTQRNPAKGRQTNKQRKALDEK